MENTTLLKVNLIEKSVFGLAAMTTVTGLSETDCVNRALQLAPVLEKARAEGATVVIRAADGTETVVKWS